MKQITLKWLKDNNACYSGIKFYEKTKTTDPLKLFKIAMENKRYDDINWGISKYLNKKQKVMYAVFAAEHVIKLYEKKYPTDNRPRNAIEAAKKYIQKQTKKNKIYAADAAVDAAAAIADAASAYAAAIAAAAAADAAADAADDADDDADDAASAYAAAIAADVKEKMKIKILNYGASLMRGAINE
jgi:hypothetical protein